MSLVPALQTPSSRPMSPMMPTVTLRAALISGLLLASGCSDAPLPTGGESSAAVLEYSEAAVMAVAVATGHNGTAFFDNSLPCARRGLVEYVDIAAGRQALFTGCDTGNDVVLDGTVVITGRARDADPSLIATLYVSSGLRARTGTGATTSLGSFTIAGIAFDAGTTDLALRLRESSVQLLIGGATAVLDSRTTAEGVLNPPGIVIGRIPNPTGSADALTDADLRRLVVHDVFGLAHLLFGETIESARGAHSHALGCGTTDVAPDAQKPAGYVRLVNAWNSCVLAPGSLFSGNFQQGWDTFSNSRMAMRVTGPVTIGGGVPVTTFSLIEWTLDIPPSYPGNAEISGRIVANGVSRTFRFTVLVDD